jgi:hypothetical protein
MWGAPCSQQGSALTCLIPGAPILQMLHLEMSSYDLIHKNLWPSGANRWVVCVRVDSHFLCRALYISWLQLQAVHWSCHFVCLSLLLKNNVPLKWWTFCTLQAKWLMESFSWHLDKCFLMVILCNHQIQPFLSVIFPHKMIMETFRKIHGVDKCSSLMTLLCYNHSFRVQG